MIEFHSFSVGKCDRDLPVLVADNEEFFHHLLGAAHLERNILRYFHAHVKNRGYSQVRDFDR